MRDERWANEEEKLDVLKAFGDKSAGGPILHTHNGKLYIYSGEGHMLELGVSGSGKSRRGTIPMIRSFIESKESFVVVDPKGEIYYNTECYIGKEYDTKIINFRDLIYGYTDYWNPLDIIKDFYYSDNDENKNYASVNLEELAFSLYPIPPKADPFWAQSARSLFIGAVYALLDAAKPEHINICNVYNLIAEGDSRFGASTYLKEFVGMLEPTSVAAIQLHSYITTADDTRGGIRSVFLEGISMFARSEGLKMFSSYSDLYVNKLRGDKPTAIYIILPDESPVYDNLAGVLTSQLLNHYIRIAQKVYNGRLPIRLNVCLEELGNIGGAITNLPHLMSAGRSRNIRVQMVLQSYSQLRDIYGSSKATTIISNADVLLAYRTNNWDTLRELSGKCGSRRNVDNGIKHTEPLITESQLGAMNTGQALVMISGRTKYIETFPDYTEMFDCSNWRPPKKKKSKMRNEPEMFDMKSVVKRKKQEMLDATRESSSLWDAPRLPVRSVVVDEKKQEAKKVGEPPLDLDDLIAKIDRQIAELEAEERAEKEKEKKRNRRTKKDKQEEEPDDEHKKDDKDE
ncbi:MAG: type IV secretory system conjugative DNA transfer family protein [Lachnospiraceae bacterium]|nr:type IV secretory system conjugative DNA transfer family protein [Lachnospiraceae bacterium]